MLAPTLAFAFAVSTVQPTSQTVVKWPVNKLAYFLHPAASADVPPKVAHDQLRASFDGWSGVPCTSLQFVEYYHCNTALKACLYDKKGGVGVPCNVETDCPSAVSLQLMANGYNNNGRNELAWIETSNWKFGQYVLGVTVPARYNNGQIFESDIAFNGYHHKWTATANEAGNKTQHIQSVGIHEIGHFFGVQHMLDGFTKNDPPTMAPNVWPFATSATLNPDDVKAACFLHPKGGTYSCQNDSDCPYMNDKDPQSGEEYYNAKLICKTSTCVFGGATTGSTALGGECTNSKQCTPGLFCQPFGNVAYCSQACLTAEQNCPSGFACYGYQNGGGKGACLPGKSQPTPSAKPGEACDSSPQCTTLMCLDGVCRVQCSPKTGAPCDAATEQCAPLPGGSTGACVAKEKPPAKTPLDGACQAPEECDSGICLKVDLEANAGSCRKKCEGKGSCGNDALACVAQAEGFSACLPGSDKVPPGSACSGPADCESGLCIADGAAQFCSKTCTVGNAGSCPCGMACEKTTAGDICYPGKKLGCVVEGGACAGASECASGACQGGACRVACSVAKGGGCGAGQGCARLETSSAKGACSAQGPKAQGESCAADAECQSLFCAPDVTKANALQCQKPCEPSHAEACGPGLACSYLSAQLGACYLVADAPNVQPVAAASESGCTAAKTGKGGLAASGYAAAAGLLFAVWALQRRRRRAEPARAGLHLLRRGATLRDPTENPG